LRWESRSNPDFGIGERTHNAQQDYRWFLHANVKFRDLFRVFVQGAFNHVEDQDGPFQPTLENHGDLQQLFFDWKFAGNETPFALRAGRQELAYGAYRLVGPLDWVSNRRRFDAVKLMHKNERWNVDVFYAKPVVVQRHEADDWNEGYDLYGAYATYKHSEHHGADLYFFGVDRTEDTINPNSRVGDQSIYTLGARLFGQSSGWDYDGEFSGQWGKWAGDTVQAWSWVLDGGYSFVDVPLTPRLSAGLEWSSGDGDPNDGIVNTFSHLFPFDHQCIGMQDLVGRQNLTRVFGGLDIWPIARRLKASIVFLHYWLSEEEDHLYNAGGVPLLRDLKGRSGVEVAQELDLWIEWTMNANSTFSVGYSHVWDDRFVHDLVPGGDDPDMVLVQYRYRF
jgi:hypothetical protein